MEKIKVGYVGFGRDCVRLKHDNPDLDVIHITDNSKLIGRNFNVIIKGYGWEIIGKYDMNELVSQRKALTLDRTIKMEFAYKHPFRFWLSKIIKRFKNGKATPKRFS